ncbi:phosphoribosylamine--glycine ligase [soil metagenome]
MKIMVIGAGSREHALAARFAAEGHVVVTAPGNAGTARHGKNLAVRADDVDGLVAAAKSEGVDFVVVGPEVPLVLGVVDALAVVAIPAFGPSRAAARLEGSKDFMKQFLKRHRIPTAAFEVFTDADAAEAYVRAKGGPIVVKASGLAAGKGVVVAETTDDAVAAVRAAMRDRAFGESGSTIVIEEVLRGEEASFHALCDGDHAVALAPAQDHKRIFDGDRGPNTGGMGAYAPASIVARAVTERVMQDIVIPTLRGMREEGAPFRGVLFVGLMIDAGVPSVIEFNVRFGDPECCVLVPLVEGRFSDLWYPAAKGELPDAVPTAAGSCLAVVLAAEGYPAKPTTGDLIEGLDDVASDAHVYQAGTKVDHGNVVTSGGRVLTVTAHAPSLAEAREKAYAAASSIRFRGMQLRRDIGFRALGSKGAS